MKLLCFILLIICISCSTDKGEEYLLKGEILLKNDTNGNYDEIKITKSYLILLNRKNDTVIKIFKKENLSHVYAYAIKGHGDNNISYPEFMKTNSKEPANSDEFWIVDNKLTFNRVRISNNKITFNRKYITVAELMPSTQYNVTSKEIYAVPIVDKNVYGHFCYANEDEGIYWVDPPKFDSNYKFCKSTAYLSNICVSEKHNKIVSALRFFNRIDIFDLDGCYIKSLNYGKSTIKPLLTKDNRSIDVQSSIKCFIDMCSTDKNIYCIYSGSQDFSNNTTLLVFTWDGKLNRRVILDSRAKQISIDHNEKYIYTISADKAGGNKIIKYKL